MITSNSKNTLAGWARRQIRRERVWGKQERQPTEDSLKRTSQEK